MSGGAIKLKQCYNTIADDFVYGENFKCDSFCIIEPGVIVFDNVRLRSYVELRTGTMIGSDCYIDSGVRSSGKCHVGNGVTLRYGVIIARGCRIGHRSYICPQVMFNNVDHEGNQAGGATVGDDCFIGTNATIGAGITIAPRTVIGAKALVLKDIKDPGGVWVGIPARRIK